jgi:NAD(P)-dependent dehydrogenase (short-subunit alcohol dehydrogenase family)
MKGKVCIITGANSGIGKATALEFAKSGATLVMACRDRAKGESALAEITEASGSTTIELMILDLSIQKSVREMATSFLKKYDRLHVLVNNAGVFKSRRVVTPDGLETMFSTSFLGHFLLTNLLLDRLKTSAPSRIINVTAPSTTKLNFDDLQGEEKFSAFTAFGASKMCNLLFSYDLARRLSGTNVTSNAIHPGLSKSNIMNEASGILRWGLNLLSSPPDQAAKAITYLASAGSLEGVTGKFFKGQKEIASAPYARDEQIQRQLWDVGEKLVRMT